MDSEPLPAGWEQVGSAEEGVYYWNVVSNETVWTRPTSANQERGRTPGGPSAGKGSENHEIPLASLYSPPSSFEEGNGARESLPQVNGMSGGDFAQQNPMKREPANPTLEDLEAATNPQKVSSISGSKRRMSLWKTENMPVPVRKRVVATAKQGFYSANPFKTDQFERNEEIHSENESIDCSFTVLYIACLVLFILYAATEYSYRDPIESWGLEPMGNQPPVQLSIATKCTSWAAWACYNDWFGNRTSVVKVSSNYSKSHLSDSSDACRTSQEFRIDSHFAHDRFNQTVCYSTKYEDGLDIAIPFDETSMYGDDVALRVTITSEGSDMVIVLDMEPHQRKTAYIGQNIHLTKPSGFMSELKNIAGIDVPWQTTLQEPYNADLFYDGKNAGTTALLRIRLSQFANVARISTPGG